jgi:hypothetical protein
MHPTRVRLLVAIAVVAAALGWGLTRIVDGQSGRILPVPWLAAGALWLLAAGVAIWAWQARPRLQRRPGARPMPPVVAARSAALAMAGSRIGALVAGAYAGVAVALTARLSIAAGAQTFWAASAAAVGGAALVAASLWLEHLCRLPVQPK